MPGRDVGKYYLDGKVHYSLFNVKECSFQIIVM